MRDIETAHIRGSTAVIWNSQTSTILNGDLKKVATLKEEKLTVVKEHVRRRVVTRDTCVCKHCGERTTPRSYRLQCPSASCSSNAGYRKPIEPAPVRPPVQGRVEATA